VIQHDNAPPHQSVFTGSPELLAKCQELEIDVTIREQPPHLGISCALKSWQYHNSPTTLTQLIEQTKQTYNEFPVGKLIQMVMNAITSSDVDTIINWCTSVRKSSSIKDCCHGNMKPCDLHPIFIYS